MPMHQKQPFKETELGNGNITCHDSLQHFEKKELTIKNSS
jgi:hypothetical protein